MASEHVSTPRIELDAPQLRGRDGLPYLADRELIEAANAALLLGRPLLLTGEPGCGKTDFAWAAASFLAHYYQARETPYECYIRSDSCARDLLYRSDALARFGDAHHGDDDLKREARDPRRYIELEPLGRALLSSEPCVVLIDEIDKAPRDLPNDLLQVILQRRIEIPEIPEARPGDDRLAKMLDESIERDGHALSRWMKAPEEARTRAWSPFIVITSNVERQLPAPFLRRCVFHCIRFPEAQRLRQIVSAWLGNDIGHRLIEDTMAVFMALRSDSVGLEKKPGTAELQDYLQVLGRYQDRSIMDRFREIVATCRDQGAGHANWKNLPFLSCLVKMREDLERLRVIDLAMPASPV